MNSKVLKAGTLRAVHVFVPALQDAFAGKGDGQVWAVRSSLYGYRKMVIASQVDILGPSQGVSHFDMPLPGTGGRGVALVYTTAAIRIHFEGDKPKYIDTGAEVKPASEPKTEPAPAPLPVVSKPSSVPQEPRSTSLPREVWYTSYQGRKARYRLLGYIRQGRVARLEGDREGEAFTFLARAGQVSEV